MSARTTGGVIKEGFRYSGGVYVFGSFVHMLRPKCLVLALCLLPVLGQAEEEYGNDPRDPWEGFNRSVFEFNDIADRYVAAPAARAYKAVTPDPVDQGIDNVFSNLGEVKNFVNDVLQGKPSDAMVDVGRFLINTTVGVLGLFDVAGHIGLERQSEDFGQTLAHWGVGSGPYLVLPFLGPSTVRDGPARVVDGYVSPLREVEPMSADIGLMLLDLVQTRAKLLGSEDLISGDRYIFMKDAYLQRREFLINDGELIQDSFGDEDFESFDF